MCHADFAHPANAECLKSAQQPSRSRSRRQKPGTHHHAPNNNNNNNNNSNGHGWVLFRLGKLRFGAHGLMGSASLLLTVWTWMALDNNNNNNNDNNNHRQIIRGYQLPLVLITQGLLTCLVSHATTLLSQVPPYTTIVPGLIVAPHREAFQRTISVMLYLVCRILLQVVQQQGSYHQLPVLQGNNLLWTVLSGSLLLRRYWPLVPSFRGRSTPTSTPKQQQQSSVTNSSSSDQHQQNHHHPSLSQWTNGNTWIFVVPMFLATTLDLMQLVLYDDDLMTIGDLVDVQLTGLLLAFGFSLGFRHYLPMPLVYFGAASAVFRIMRLQFQKL